jgi:hypothetical protein
MNRTTALAALFVVSLAAGAWLFRPFDSGRDTQPESCTSGESCDLSPNDAEQPAPPPVDQSAEPPVVADPATDRAVVTEPVPEPPAPSPARSVSRPAPAPEPPPDGKALRAEADRLFTEGRVPEGVEKMRQATDADPTAKNHGDLGDVLARLTAIDEALIHLRAAAELDPGNADRWIALANAYYRAVDPGEAWKAEKRAKAAEPGLVLGRDKSGRRVREGDSEPRKP